MEHVESSEWRTYVQECVHEDGIRVLRSLLANKNICIDMVKKAATAFHNIRHVEPDSITPFQIQEKYGFDWRYQEYVLDPCEDNEQDADSTAEPAQTNEVQTLAKRIIEQNREAYDSLASSDKERPE